MNNGGGGVGISWRWSELDSESFVSGGIIRWFSGHDALSLRLCSPQPLKEQNI